MGVFFMIPNVYGEYFGKYTFVKQDSYENSINDFYYKIKNKYNNSKYKSFFAYFKRTWRGKKIPIKIWNYYDTINANDIDERLYFTNNANENINRYLNSNLKRTKCSKNHFKCNDTIF